MNTIKRLGTEIYDVKGHVGILVQVETINQLVKKWSKNRESDKQRVVEIANHIKTNGWVPMTIYTAVLPIEGIVCYDGNHRREAFKMLAPAMDTSLVVIDVLKNPGQIYEAFKHINMAVPVSLIDTLVDHESLKLKQEIEGLIKKYETDYRGFVSTSARCNTPNFNRDNLKDQLHRFLTSRQDASINDLKTAMDVLNDAYKNDVRMGAEHSRLNRRVIDKCRNEGLWLFAFRREIPDVDLEWALTFTKEDDLIKMSD